MDRHGRTQYQATAKNNKYNMKILSLKKVTRVHAYLQSCKMGILESMDKMVKIEEHYSLPSASEFMHMFDHTRCG